MTCHVLLKRIKDVAAGVLTERKLLSQRRRIPCLKIEDTEVRMSEMY